VRMADTLAPLWVGTSPTVAGAPVGAAAVDTSAAGAYTRPLFSSTGAVSDTKAHPKHP